MGLSSKHAAKRLQQKNGFSLLLLTVGSFDNSGSRKFIVCVDNTKAELILANTQLTVLDYERVDIVRTFGKSEIVSDGAIRSAVAHFEECSVSNSRMMNKTTNKLNL